MTKDKFSKTLCRQTMNKYMQTRMREDEQTTQKTDRRENKQTNNKICVLFLFGYFMCVCDVYLCVCM